MGPVIADTHIAIWYTIEPNRLSKAALTALDEASAAGDPIYLASISLLELLYLVEKGRQARTTLQQLYQACDRPGAPFVTIPLDTAVTRAAEEIRRDDVPDMPDRIIAATAFLLALSLVTRDAQIRAVTNIQTIW